MRATAPYPLTIMESPSLLLQGSRTFTLPPRTERDDYVHRIGQYGVATLTDAEIIATLIRTGHAGKSALDVAKDLLAACGGCLMNLNRMNSWELSALGGIGHQKAAVILAASELGRRRHCLDPRSRPQVSNSATAYDVLRPVLQDLPHEEFWVLLMDRGNRLIDRTRISQGGLHGTVADPKSIFKVALERRASGIVLAHNHPSGQLRPSEEDIRLTRKLVEGSRLLDMEVQDHLIVTGLGYFSFADNGMLR